MANGTNKSSFKAASLNLLSECLHCTKWGHTARAYPGCGIDMYLGGDCLDQS